MTIDVHIAATVLESEVAISLHGAVFHCQILNVTQRLSLLDVTVHQTQTLGIPSQEFAIDDRIIDGHVLRFPESILRIEHRVVDFDVLAVLEAVVTIDGDMIHEDILAVLEDVVGLIEDTVLHMHVLHMPHGFLSVRETHVIKLDAVHAAEHLRALHHRIIDFTIA